MAPAQLWGIFIQLCIHIQYQCTYYISTTWEYTLYTHCNLLRQWEEKLEASPQAEFNPLPLRSTVTHCDAMLGEMSVLGHMHQGDSKSLFFHFKTMPHIEILGDVRGGNDREAEETPDKDWKATWRAVINGDKNCFLSKYCIFLAVTMTHTTHFHYSPLLFHSCNLL